MSRSPSRSTAFFSRRLSRWASIVLFFTACAAPSSNVPPPIRSNLELGKSHHDEVGPGEAHDHRLDLQADEAAVIELDQSEVDLEVVVLDPAGHELLRFDSPVGRRMAERACVVARAGGAHRVRVSPFGPDGGGYTIELARRRPATVGDHACFSAAKAFMAAEIRHDAPDLDSSVAEYEKAADGWSRAAEPRLRALALLRLGVLLKNLGRSREAVGHLQSALASPEGARTLQLDLLNQLGLAHLDLGETDLAEELFSQALALAREAGQGQDEAAALNNLALVDETIGETHRAIRRYRQALRLRTEHGLDQERVLTLRNLGDAYGLLDHHAEALALLHEALALAQQSQASDREAGILASIGWIHFQRGEPHEAVVWLEQARALWVRQGHRNGEAAVLDRLGSARRQDGDFPGALAAFRQSLAISRATGNARDAAVTEANIGCLYQQWGRADAALAVLASVRKQFHHGDDPKASAHVEYCLARSRYERGELALALDHVERALDIVDELYSTARQGGNRYLPISLWQDYADLHFELLMRRWEETHDPRDLAHAFAAGDLARARNLFELVLESRVGVRSTADETLLARERAIQQQLNSVARTWRTLREGAPNPERLIALERELGELSLQLEEARAAIRAADPRYAELTNPHAVPLSDLQQMLGSRTVLLSYHLGNERSHLLVVSPSAVSSWPLAPKATLEAHALALYHAVRQRQTLAQLELSARSLAELLLPSAALPEGTEKLLVIAQGLLHYVPFAVLPSPLTVDAGTESRLLVDDFELSYLPSAAVLKALRERDAGRRPVPQRLVAFADAVFSANDDRLGQEDTTTHEATVRGPIELARLPEGPLPRLPHTRAEALAIDRLTTSGGNRLFLDFAASKANVLAAPLARFAIVHFATHALIDERFPELSGLALTRFDENGQAIDGDLHLHEIYRLRLAADLVVLSGCQTALGRNVRGEGLLGLTHGFLYAGSSRALVSLWSVDDRATAAFMAELYRGLEERREAPVAALRSAQRWMRLQEGWNAPYFWAPFILQGDHR